MSQNIFEEFNSIIQEAHVIVKEYEQLHEHIHHSEPALMNLFLKKTYKKNYDSLSELKKKYDEVYGRLKTIYENHQQALMSEHLQQYLFIKSFYEYLTKINEVLEDHLKIQHTLAFENKGFRPLKPKGTTDRYLALFKKIEEADSLGKTITENAQGSHTNN